MGNRTKAPKQLRQYHHVTQRPQFWEYVQGKQTPAVRQLQPHIHRTTITTARKWNQFECPATDEQVKKVTHIPMEYYTAPQRNELLICNMKEVEVIMSSKMNQKHVSKNR